MFCHTCSPPQPAQAREYLDKAAAKCEQAKRMNDHTHYAMYSYLFPSLSSWFNDAGSELHGMIKMIDALLGGEDALTHRMTCYQQATTHYEEALRISIHDRDYAKLDRIVTMLWATLMMCLEEHERAAARGTRDHFMKDNKVSIDTIASTCDSAVQMIPQDAEIWRVDAKGPSEPTFDGYNKLDLHSYLGYIFYMLGDSCDSSEAVREQKQEYFKRARINVELATLGVELATSGVSSLSDAPDQDSFGNADNKARLERSKVRLAVLKASRTSRVIQAPQVAL
jgi:tetratricopeptide (TPR) repeat protein